MQNDNFNNLLFNNLLSVINVLSFIIQLENNEELHQQSSNDDVIENLHNDIILLLEDNRVLFNIVIEQNENILNILKGEKYHDEQKEN